ncbi:helix-turn-helix domain-containing protein [Neokomagataea anthophila]|uniref:XRE family transcriptional regulator n=1 Tax=Neokomagataea anthophila TaxID=2826925 RepID=A0ABS5E944_9PROT|nr:XRE family transcriptional regulator [Neokomagataea anthophila]MBR0560033.1 XRE family transcriptional regulator [Neokomagataea anthophila]
MMMDIRPIRTNADYDWAVQEIEQYFDNEPAPMTPEAERFDVLTALINAYDSVHHPIAASDPVEVIRLYMEQNDLKQADFGRVIGSQSRASEVLNKQRALSTSMIARIRAAWGISADLLVGVESAASRAAA